MQSDKKIHPLLTTSLIILIIGVLIVIATNLNGDTTNPDTTTRSEPSKSTTQSKNTDSQYKNGTYTADGEYFSPGGTESIGVTITLEDGKVADTSIEKRAEDDPAKRYQEQFASNYRDQVVGKPIDELSLSRIAGSSLTSAGFNKAIDQIKSDAQK